MLNIIDIFQNKIIDPMINQTGYNFYNTFLIASIVLIFYFLGYKLLKKHIKIDKEFLNTLIIFTIIGAFLRILEEDYIVFGGLIKRSLNPLEIGFYFYTPGLLILLVLLYLFFFLISYLIYKQKYFILLKKIGLIFLLFISIIVLINIVNWPIFFLSLIIICLIFYYLIKIFNKLIKTNQYYENKLLILSQTIDFSATLIGVYFFKGYLYEEHFISRTIIEISPIFFIILKLFLCFLFIYILDYLYYSKTEKDQKIRYIKQIIIILGFLTGIRNLLTIWLIV